MATGTAAPNGAVGAQTRTALAQADVGSRPNGRGANRNGNGHAPAQAGLWTLTLGSIGVVYGDIGTSPLYAFREALKAAGEGHGGITPADVLGVLSLILWALIVIVTVKYVLVLLRADNKGEGGTLSLTALAQRALGGKSRIVFVLGVAGAALFYGDSIITPAISVLSAVEGLKLVTPRFENYVVPLTVVILFGLFAVQSRGTGRVATFFGPIMAAWFLTLAATGLVHIFDHPGVLASLNPLHGVRFVAENGSTALVALGAVFLAVTGAEALYADLGHFGRRPIQNAWFGIVFPALALNYLGQGALVLSRPEAAENPFFLLVPEWALLPMVILATLATVIASQAVITGAFSLSRQAIHLGLLPRFEVQHTSDRQFGQIFMPRINLLLLIGVLLLVFMFASSSRLASAYGVAVTATLVVDSALTLVVIRHLWHWPLWATLALIVPFLAVELTFFGANLLKLADGAWLPLLFSTGLVVVISTWVRGTTLLFKKAHKTDVPLTGLVESLENRPPLRVPGTAVFLTSDPDTAPAALMHNLKHNKVLHEHNVILTVVTTDTPYVPDEERVELEQLSESFRRVYMTFGYMETPNVPKGLAISRKLGWNFDIMSTSFFLSRRSIRPSPRYGMPMWQDKLFIALANSAADATEYFRIPTGRVVEVGTQVAV